MPKPEAVAVSTLQSLGKPAVPCVQVGQAVKEGEIIAKADGAISSNVFASISGTVAEIKEETGASGGKETFIVIKANAEDGKFTYPPLTSPSSEEIKERILECGIVGLGGAGFPTAVKVAPKTPVDTLIVNGAECEPYLPCDHRLMVEKTEEIVKGARYVAKALGVSNIVIGIEANKPDAISAFEPYEDIKVVILRKQYPMGGEKQLIYVTTGRKVGLGKLPADCGVIVQNVATCYAVCEAVELGKPLYERAVTVSGKAIKEPKNLWVKVGTQVKDIIAYCGGEYDSLENYPYMSSKRKEKLLNKQKHAEEMLAVLKEKNDKSYEKQALKKQKLDAKIQEILSPKKVVQGGPMTGVALPSYDLYTHKTTSGILLLDKKEAAAEEPTPCLNCGKCADVCPMHLMPMNTAFYSSAGDFESAAKLGNALSCIECGACEYVCPAKRPLIQAIRKTKAELRKKK